VRNILSKSQRKLAEVFQALIERNNHLSTAKWFRYGDTCSKIFFDFPLIGKKKIILKELKVDGKIIFDQRDLSHYITKFYANFYALEVHAPGTFEAQNRCWESIPTRVTEAMNVDVTTPLWDKCEDETHTPKSGKLESSWTPKNLELEFKGQNTSY